MKKNKLGFSIIEVMIGIFIFTIGLVSVYSVIASIFNVNEYNKNFIIASNLASEQLEFVRNIRDSNYVKIQKYDFSDPQNQTGSFMTGSYYKIENDFSTWATFPIKVEKINIFSEGKENISDMATYEICLDSKSRYVYDCSTSGNKNTGFYKYIKIEEIKDGGGNTIEDAFKVISKVIWNIKGYHEFEVSTIIADWKRL